LLETVSIFLGCHFKKHRAVLLHYAAAFA